MLKFVLGIFVILKLFLCYNSKSSDGFVYVLDLKEIENKPILFLGNKCDVSVMKKEDVVKEFELDKIINKFHLELTCAITTEGVYEGFFWLTKILQGIWTKIYLFIV